MTPFLCSLARTYYRNFGSRVSDFTFDFPNRRAGRFFVKYLAEAASGPIFSPRIISIADLFGELAELQTADRIRQLFVLYRCYCKVSGSNETFDQFIFWGEMLLNDFDDVDKSMADARQVFRNIQDLRQLDADLSYLSEEQIDAIRRFWTNFLPISPTDDAKQSFLEIWEVLHLLYTDFRDCLRSEGWGYEGMIFRDVAELAKRSELSLEGYERLVFVGLNGQSKAEEALLTYARKQGIADFYWDYASPLVRDDDNPASLFVKNNETKFPSEFDISAEDEITPVQKPVVEAIGIPSFVGQAKQVYTLLDELVKQGELKDNHLVPNTAIVLADENLLLPTLYSIPTEIEKINVTMGYGLANSSVVALLYQLAEVQKNFRTVNGELGVYFRFVLPILSHNQVVKSVGKLADDLRRDILKNNRLVVPVSQLSASPLLQLIFTPLTDSEQIPNVLKKILQSLYQSVSYQKMEDESDTTDARSADIEQEFIVQCYRAVNRIADTMRELEVQVQVDVFFKLLKKLISNISVSFEGEPLSGLQVMGVLETRALDFDNLILLSMNEGVFPSKRGANSFIPYNLRRGFGLPTYEFQDSIFAYHFYRLISRAKRITMLYDTRADKGGEISRYFHQIKYLYSKHFDICERIVVYQVETKENQYIEVQKTPEVMAKLQDFLLGGKRSLSASAINQYLDCPLQFYFGRVCNLSVDEELTDKVEANVFGSIYHYVMENLYKRLEKKTVTADALKALSTDSKKVQLLVKEGFAKYYFKTEKVRDLSGQLLLIAKIIEKYVYQTLKQDQKHTPFVYVRSEEEFDELYLLPSGAEVKLKGFIDRVDEKDDTTRIIDYKTGTGELSFRSVSELFDMENGKRPKAVLQVFLYALMYARRYPTARIAPSIYFLRNIFKSDFSFNIEDKGAEKGEERVIDFEKYKSDFQEFLNNCLGEIFSPDVPFRQTVTGKACAWCEFTEICRK